MDAAPDESTEPTATSNSTVMLTPVAGHDKTVWSTIISMSATAAGDDQEEVHKCGCGVVRGQASMLRMYVCRERVKAHDLHH